MKNIFIPLFYCLLNTLPLLAQTNCQSILTNARNAAAKGNYKEAIDKYITAVDCDRNLSTTANSEIKAMFDKINKLKTKAEQAETKAKAEAEKAQKAETAAKVAKDDAQTANQNLKKTIAQVVLLQLQQADKAILNLSYDTALVQTNRIADLGELPDSTLKRYQEIAYWYTETNQTTKAINTLNQAAQHLKKLQSACPNTAQLNTHIQQLNPQHHQQLQKRYYPDMVAIKGGTYTMGSPNGETNRGDDETQHPATVSDFKIARTETTVFQFALYCQATYPTDSIDISDFLKDATEKNDARHPVVSVKWYDAVQYANWLSQRQQLKALYNVDKEYALDTTAQGYRLPTEAEWEYACRAGSATPFNTGPNLTTAQANYDGDSPYANYPKGDDRQKTTPAAYFSHNAWGLYDMYGNVWEWCHDWYGDYLPQPPPNYKGAIYGLSRVLRGGSWSDTAQNCRSANRLETLPSYRYDAFGFRLVFVPQF